MLLSSLPEENKEVKSVEILKGYDSDGYSLF